MKLKNKLSRKDLVKRVAVSEFSIVAPERRLSRDGRICTLDYVYKEVKVSKCLTPVCGVRYLAH